MDANKLELLREVYEIRPCCGLCRHCRLGPLTDWGTCAVLNYTHAKHTGAARELSVNRMGHCDQFEADDMKIAETLGAFAELFRTDVRG